jgi:predicted RNA binding protein YcfA (HicA-like mRNA interferase family)
MNSKDLIKILEQDGWKIVATKGSHYQYKHQIKKGRVTVPHPKKEIPIGTISSILKQANLSKNLLRK